MNKVILAYVDMLHKTQLFIDLSAYSWRKNNQLQRHKLFLKNQLKGKFPDEEIDVFIKEYFSQEEISKAAISHARARAI